MSTRIQAYTWIYANGVRREFPVVSPDEISDAFSRPQTRKYKPLFFSLVLRHARKALASLSFWLVVAFLSDSRLVKHEYARISKGLRQTS